MEIFSTRCSEFSTDVNLENPVHLLEIESEVNRFLESNAIDESRIVSMNTIVDKNKVHTIIWVRRA